MSEQMNNWLKVVRERLKRATPGPWTLSLSCQNVRFVGPDGEWIPIFKAREDATNDCIFIAHAPQDLAKALAVIELYERALSQTHHALANAQEWYISDPEDSELDRDSQIGNWIEKAFDEMKDAQAAAAAVMAAE